MHAVWTLSLDNEPLFKTVKVKPVVTLQVARRLVSLVEMVRAYYTDLLDVYGARRDRDDFYRLWFFAAVCLCIFIVFVYLVLFGHVVLCEAFVIHAVVAKLTVKRLKIVT